MTQPVQQQYGLNYWYNTICSDGQLDKIPDAVQYFEQQIIQARAELKISGSLEQAASRLPGLFEYRFGQWKEITAIVRYLNVQLNKIRKDRLVYYTTKYNKELSAREVSVYVEGDDDFVNFSFLINAFTLINDQFDGLLKALDQKNWQISNITKIRCAGIEDASI